MKPPYTIPSADDLKDFRGEALAAIDVQMEVMQRAAVLALRERRVVNITIGGKVIGRFYPDGRTEHFDLRDGIDG